MLIMLLYLAGRDIAAMKKNTETPLIGSKEIDLEVNAEKTKHVPMSHELTAGKNYSIKLGNKSFESVTKFRYFATTLRNQKTVFMKKFKNKVISWVCLLLLVQNLLSSRFISGHVNIKIHRSVILPVLWYECEIWSITLMKEHRLMFKNVVLWKVFRPRIDEVTGTGGGFIMRNFVISIPHQILCC